MGFFHEMSKLRYNKSGQCQILQKLRHRFWGKWYSRRGSCPCSHNRKWWGLSPDKYKFCKWWQFIDLACMLRHCGNHIHSICNIQLFLNQNTLTSKRNNVRLRFGWWFFLCLSDIINWLQKLKCNCFGSYFTFFMLLMKAPL